MIKNFTCHECWRDKNCECNEECDWEEGEPHECDCEHCTEEWDVEPTVGNCECICHTPVPSHCKRCNNTRKIHVEVLGNREAA